MPRILSAHGAECQPHLQPASNPIRSAIFLWQNFGASLQRAFLQSRSSCAAILTRWLCRLGRRGNVRSLIAAIRLALATLDRIAGRTTVPSAPPAADRTLIRLTHAALHRIARRAAVPSSPAISIAVRRRRTVSRRRVIILCIDNRRAADGRSADQPGRQSISCDCAHS
jgi:hypothetical protein